MDSIKDIKFNRNFSLIFGLCFTLITCVIIFIDSITKKALGIHSAVIALIGFKKAFDYHSKL